MAEGAQAKGACVGWGRGQGRGSQKRQLSLRFDQQQETHQGPRREHQKDLGKTFMKMHVLNKKAPSSRSCSNVFVKSTDSNNCRGRKHVR